MHYMRQNIHKTSWQFSSIAKSDIRLQQSFLPVCKTCIDKLYEHYCAVLGNDEDAIRRICMKFDIYYSKALAESSRKIAVDRSRVHTYISRANLSQFRGKTYDTTIDEESRQVIESVEEVKESGVKILQRTVKFFGVGFLKMSTNFFRINMMIGRHGMNVRQNLRKKSLKQFALRSLIYSVPTFPAIKKAGYIYEIISGFARRG